MFSNPSKHCDDSIFRYVCLVVQLCPLLCDPMDCSPPGSSVHGILQARILEWRSHPLLQGIFLTRDWTRSPTLLADSFPSKSPRKPILRLATFSLLLSLLFSSLCVVYFREYLLVSKKPTVEQLGTTVWNRSSWLNPRINSQNSPCQTCVIVWPTKKQALDNLGILCAAWRMKSKFSI